MSTHNVTLDSVLEARLEIYCQRMGMSATEVKSLFAFIQRGAVEIADLVVTDLTRLSELAAKYPRMDFADGTLVLLAERMRVTDIATIDERDFGIYRTKGGQVFRNLFG